MMNVVLCKVVVERIFGVGEKKKESVRGSVRNILTRHGQLRRNVSINLAV
jgi:hypothetical protein